MSWLERLKDHMAKMPPPAPKPELQPEPQKLVPRTISTTQLSEIAGIHLPSQMLKSLGIQPFAQTKTGFFWAVEDVPIILLKLSKYFSDKAKEELNKS